MSKEPWLHGHRRAERSYSTFKVRRGGSEEIPLVQGEEQWLRGHRTAERSYSTFKVRRGGCEEITLVQVRSSGCTLLKQP